MQVSGQSDNNEEVSVTEDKQESKQQPKRRGPNKPKEKLASPVVEIGRIVRYVTGAGTVRPAIITAVHEGGDGEVDLTVFNSEGSVAVVDVPPAPVEDKAKHTFHFAFN